MASPYSVEMYLGGYILETNKGETIILPMNVTGRCPLPEGETGYDVVGSLDASFNPDVDTWIYDLEKFLGIPYKDGILSVEFRPTFWFGRWTMPGYLDAGDWQFSADKND